MSESTPPIRRLRPATPDPLASFLAWPGSSSLATLLSAACLLGGLWGVLAPTIGDEATTSPRWSVVATLAAYLLCLVGAIGLMCRLRPGNPDAVAATVVGVPLTIGLGVVLGLIAPHQPGLALWAGAGALAMATGLWLVWRRVVGGIPDRWTAGLLATLVLAGITLPILLGLVAGGFDRAVRSAGHAITISATFSWWSGSALVVFTLLGLVLAGALRTTWVMSTLPFLQRPALRWLLVLVAAATTELALWIAGYSVGLDLCLGDLLPHLVLLAVIANELRARAAVWLNAELPLALVPALVALVVAITGTDAARMPETAVRGSGILVDLWQTWSSLPLALTWSTCLLALLAWRRGSVAIGTGAFAGLLILVLAGTGTWRWAETILVMAIALAGLGWRVRRPAMLLTAVMLAEVAIVLLPVVGAALRACAVPTTSALLLVASGTVLVAGAWRPQLVSPAVARCATWLVLIGLLSLTGRLLGNAPRRWAGGSVLATALILLAWRRRDPHLCWPLLPPAIVVLPDLLPRQRAWLGVWAAFALLAGAVGLAWRSARRGRGDPGAATPPGSPG
jgi:hypothetical protein